MFVNAVAFLLSMALTFILGGLLGFMLRFLLAILLLPLITMFRKKRVGATVISSGPWILTIEFIANLFYGWFANYIGVWVFNSMGTAIDWFYPFLVMISFLWFDIQRIQQEKKRTKSFEDSELRERLPLELVNNEMHKFRMDNLMSDRVNSRVTALFGKFAGVVIGGFNLILLNS